jgi:hypothetical protein
LVTCASTLYSEAVGATSAQPGNVVLGYNALASGAYGVAIGYEVQNCSTVDGFNSSVAIGYDARVCSYSSISIGTVSRSSDSSISIGTQTCSANTGISIGFQTIAECNSSIVIGRSNCSLADYGIVIGSLSSQTSAAQAAVIGYCSCSSHVNSTVIGVQLASERADTVHVDNLVAYGQGASKSFDIGSVTGTATVDFDEGNNQYLTLTGSTTLTFSNPIAGANYSLLLTQGGVGSYTVTWPTIKWANAIPPTLSTTVGKIDLVNLLYDGTSYYGSWAVNFA